jgi:hypothetical protein
VEQAIGHQVYVAERDEGLLRGVYAGVSVTRSVGTRFINGAGGSPEGGPFAFSGAPVRRVVPLLSSPPFMNHDQHLSCSATLT